MPLDRKDFFHISAPLDDLLLIGIHPLGNLKDEASTRFHRLCELTRPSVIFCHIIWSILKNHPCILASCLQVSGINLTCWSWHLSSKILVNLEELKVHLGELWIKKLGTLHPTCWFSKISNVNFSFHDIAELFSVFPLSSSSTLGVEKEAWDYHSMIITQIITQGSLGLSLRPLPWPWQRWP